jgi:hypothetical protein
MQPVASQQPAKHLATHAPGNNGGTCVFCAVTSRNTVGSWVFYAVTSLTTGGLFSVRGLCQEFIGDNQGRLESVVRRRLR